MDALMYPKTVAAALTETTSKFALAEALANEIPPKRSGPATGKDVPTLIEEVRAEIVAAGGEPRSVETLMKYRKVALWVQAVNGPNFQWLDGVSFTTHSEARQAGMSYADFAALDSPTVDAIRKAKGKAGTDGPAAKIAKNWTAEEQAEAVQAILAKNPDVLSTVGKNLVEQEVQQKTLGSHTGPALTPEEQAQFEEFSAKTKAAQQAAKDDPFSTDPDAPTPVDINSGLLKATHHLREVSLAISQIGVNPDLAHSGVIKKLSTYYTFIMDSLESGTVSMDEGLIALLEGDR